MIVDADSAKPGIEENKATFSRGFRRTLSALRDANKSVVVVGPIPEVGDSCHPTLEALSKEFGFRLVYPHQALCTNAACRVEDGGFPLYSDDDHLTATAARSLEFLFRDVFVTATGPVLSSP